MRGSFKPTNCKCEKGKRCKCRSTWEYVIDIGTSPSTGKRMQKRNKGFVSEKAARLHAAELMLSVNNGTFVNESDITVEKFTEQFLEMYEHRGNAKPSTVRLMKMIGKTVNKFIGKVKAKDVTRTILQNAVNDMSEKYANNTLTNLFSFMNILFKEMIKLELIKSNPMQHVYKPRKKEEEKPIKYLEKHDLKRLLDDLRDNKPKQDYIMFLLLAYTGMRVGELCGLKWSDIDFTNHAIEIKRTLIQGRNMMDYEIQTPKTKKSQRLIHVSELVINELINHRKRINVYRMEKANVYHNEDFVFVSERFPGYPFYGGVLHNRMVKYTTECGLPRLTPHSLRHTHTSLLAEAGVSLETIMERLGHTNDNTTRNVYLHVTKTLKRDASDKFSALMDSL